MGKLLLQGPDKDTYCKGDNVLVLNIQLRGNIAFKVGHAFVQGIHLGSLHVHPRGK